MDKLEDKNVSLDFRVQSLIKERDNVKLEYQKLFNSIKKTRSQNQKEMDELIAHVSEKTYAYGAIRAENQNLLFAISELKTRLENIAKVPKLQTAIQGDALLHYDAEMELMNLILLCIPNDIYNSMDACTSAKFVAEPGEALVSVYNYFAQLMNDLERNDMHFPIVTINTKFLNSLQLEWLKYVTQVRLAKCLTVDMFDDLFDYLQQFEKLVNVSRANKLEKSHDPLALVAHTGSSSRNISFYYVTHPTSVVDYEDEYQ
ncbi:hypothetical protein Tco_0585026 [Tanacetum coccineum]